jgi:hypothetical protein
MTTAPRWLAFVALVWSLGSGCSPSAPSVTLHKAVEKGDLTLVQKHIAAHTDLNAKNATGWTPLHIAATNGNLAVVQALTAGGADPARTTPQGKTPLDLAREKGQTAIVQHFEAKAGAGKGGGRRLIDGGLGVSDAMDGM